MVSPGVATMVEVATLARDAVRLVRRNVWPVLTWFALGWSVHTTGLFGSALLGADHAVLANLVFVLAVVAELASYVLMIHVLRPGPEPTLDVLALALGPFLAVYALWGFIDDEVNALFTSNYLLLGLGDVQHWSISVSDERLPFYLVLAGVGWLLRQAVRLLRRRLPTPAAVLGLVAEGLYAFSAFVVVLIAARAAWAWLRGRVVWVELLSVWDHLLGLLPDLTLPLGATLRELAQGVVAVVPGAAATVFGLPLMWFALTATVYGWRDYRAKDLVAGTRLAARLQRLEDRPAGSGRRLLLLATADARGKYLPVAQALRLVGRAGPRFVGAYLLLATAITAAGDLLTIGLSVLVGPRSTPVTLLLDPVQSLLVQLVVMTASVGLYAAAFDRAVVAAEPVQGRNAITTESESLDSRPDTEPAAAAGITKLKPIGRGTS